MVPHPVQLVKTFSPFCVDSISLVKAQIQQVYLLPSELRRVTVSPNVFRHIVRIAAFPAPACCLVPKPGLRVSVFRDGSSPRLYQGSIVTVMQCNKQTNERTTPQWRQQHAFSVHTLGILSWVSSALALTGLRSLRICWLWASCPLALAAVLQLCSTYLSPSSWDQWPRSGLTFSWMAEAQASRLRCQAITCVESA